MADKILQTRIINKHADLATWNSSTLKLKEGEIALAFVDATTTDAKGNIIHVPTCVMKVGKNDANGNEQAFNALPFLSAPASDVYAWAKAQTFDEANIPLANKAIADLQEAIGQGGSVATQIDAAISLALSQLALSEVTVGTGKIISAVKQENGKVSVSTRDIAPEDIPTLSISKIDGLQAALDAKATAAALAAEVSARETLAGTVAQNTADIATEITNRTNADTALGERIDTVVGNLNKEIERATAAEGTNATAAAEAKAQADKGVADAAAVAANLATEIAARESADNKLSEDFTKAINELKSTIGNLENVMNFRGAFASKDACTNPIAGDVIVITDGDDKGKEFVYSDGAWVEFGNIDAQQTAIAALQDRMTTAEGKIGALETNSATKAELAADVTTLTNRIATEETNRANADTALGGRIDTLSGRVDDTEDRLDTDEAAIEGLGGRLTTAEGRLDSFEANYATKSELSSAESTLNGKITTLSGTVTDNKTAFDTYVESNDGKVQALETTVGENTDAIAALTENKADEADLTALGTRVGDIEANYVKISGTNLVDQDGLVIIFDCGGAV